jgi:hypothetical protein
MRVRHPGVMYEVLWLGRVDGITKEERHLNVAWVPVDRAPVGPGSSLGGEHQCFNFRHHLLLPHIKSELVIGVYTCRLHSFSIQRGSQPM